MLYLEMELRRQIRKKNVVALPVLNWTVTSRRRYGRAGSEPLRQARHEAIHEGKKKNNETRSGASWEELALEIEGEVTMGLTSGIRLARPICLVTGRILMRQKERGGYCTV